MNISLTKEMEEFISQQLQTGMYGTASELVRHALRLLIEQEQRKQAKLEALRQQIREGLDSGDAVELDVENFIQQMKARGR